MRSWILAIGVVLVPALAAADVIIGLRGRDDAGLARFIAGQQSLTGATGYSLTAGEFAAQFGAAASHVRRVSRWLHSGGCAVQRMPGRQFVRCRHRTPGPLPAALRALGDGMVDPGVLALVPRSPLGHPRAGR